MSDTELRRLSRHLSRLENVLITNPDPSLRRSPAKITSLSTSLEHARSLLIDLENSSNSDQSQTWQSTLKSQRNLLRQLQNRLHSLHDLAADHSDADSDYEDDGTARSQASSSSTEDLLATYAPALKDTHAGLEVKSKDTSQPASGASNAQLAAAGASLATALRARQPADDASIKAGSTATATGRSLSANAQEPRLASITPFSPAPSTLGKPQSTDTAALMQHHDSEQDALTSSLLTLASALKASTQSFSDSLSASNPLVDQTASSLDKNVSGLDAASKGMNKLRGTKRSWTGGVGGWLGGTVENIKRLFGDYWLWGCVAALWVVLLIVVFVLPRLRF